MRIFAIVAGLALTLGATPAIAADPGVPMEEAPLGFDWTGAYVGVVAGYGWGESRFEDATPEATNPFDIDGATGGLTVGYNFQFASNWVVGVEGDISLSKIEGSRSGDLGTPSGDSWICFLGACATDVKWYGTARARLGYAFDSLMIYGTGGLAVGRVDARVENDPTYFAEDTNVGWAAGAGVEYAFSQNWTAKLEYMHVDLGWTDRNVEPASLFRGDAEFDAVRIGVNYKF